MPRRLRHLPGPSLVEVTVRTIHSRHLLRPSPELTEIIGGCIGRALDLYPLEIIAYSFLNNHFHLLIYAQTHDEISSFMGYLSGNLAKEIGHLVGWKDKVWARRFTSIPVSDEPAAQIGRLRYVLSNGVKERLVEKAVDWPGVHAVKEILAGEPLRGTWFDRTAKWDARRRGEDPEKYDYATRFEVELAPLPCWRDLDPAEYRERVSELVADIEAEAAAERREKGTMALGVRGILAQDPFSVPEKTKRSPCPLFHAASRRSSRDTWARRSGFAGENVARFSPMAASRQPYRFSATRRHRSCRRR